MRSLIVVEVNGYAHGILYLLYGEELHVHEQLVLYGVVDAFCHGIVLRVAVLRHADLYLPMFQYVCICVAGVLYAAVRVMGQVVGCPASKSFQCLVESLEGVSCLQSCPNAGSNDFLRVVVCYQGEVAEVIHALFLIQPEGYVCYVAYPQLVRAVGQQVLGNVRI